jgi:hypothetical protein
VMVWLRVVMVIMLMLLGEVVLPAVGLVMRHLGLMWLLQAAAVDKVCVSYIQWPSTTIYKHTTMCSGSR